MELETPLTAHSQQHLLTHLAHLSPSAAARLAAQTGSVSWHEVALAHATAGPHVPMRLPPVLHPAQAEHLPPSRRDSLHRDGLGLLAEGKAAFVLMAGGQGSRLGFPGPKGAAPLGWPCDWTLFDLLVRRLNRLSALCGRSVPCLVMTSPENDDATQAWFASQTILPREGVRFFVQGTLPALDEQGRALLAAPDRLALAPDGNGGIFQALERSGLLEQLSREGVTWLHVAGVDNALSLPCDPVFLGFAHASGRKVASKSVLREDPSEKAGVFRIDEEGRSGVAEYTELGPLAEMRCEDGGLLYREANIASHLVRLDAARDFAAAGLPWHLARKRLPHLDPDTGRPSDAPACKYERFLFDAFPMAGEMALLRVERSQEFAPVKNADGADSPASALAALRAHGEPWLWSE